MTIDQIFDTVTNYYKTNIVCKSRERTNTDARHMYCYICKKKLPRISFRIIGEKINRNHATVMHSCKTIENLLQTDSQIFIDYNNLMKLLTGYQPTLLTNNCEQIVKL